MIVVNDGSPDHTGDVLADLQTRYPNLRVVTHPKNRGYGGALRSGFEHASKELICYTDGDAQYDPREFRLLAEQPARRRRRRPGVQDPAPRPARAHHHRQAVPLHRAHDVRPADPRRRLRHAADPSPRLRQGRADPGQRRHLRRDDDQDHAGRLQDDRGPGPPLPPRVRAVPVLQLPARRAGRDRPDRSSGSSLCCCVVCVVGVRRRRAHPGRPESMPYRRARLLQGSG